MKKFICKVVGFGIAYGAMFLYISGVDLILEHFNVYLPNIVGVPAVILGAWASIWIGGIVEDCARTIITLYETRKREKANLMIYIKEES